MFSFTKDIGMDLGTASVLIYIKDKGIVLNEPSVVALDKNTGKLLKVGADAQAMLGRTPGNIIAIRPLREGVISDYEVTERMIKEFLHKVMGFQLFKPRIIICVPSGITEVEERAVIDAGIQAGARRVYLIEEPVAAAIGAGIDITQPEGHMIIDIGGGTSDIAVISLSGVVESSSIKIAGDQFNEAVVKYMRRKHNLLVGERTAEEMKKQIGCVFPKDEEETMDVKGRCLLTGLPKVVTVSSTEMMDAFEEPVRQNAFEDRKLKVEDRRNKVVNIHATTQLKVVLVKPDRFENAAEIADHLRDKRTVVLNLEKTQKDVARRLLDFLSGVAYAQEGKIKKVALQTYIVTPYNVDIMGDLIDELENNGLYF